MSSSSSQRRRGGPSQCMFCPYWSITAEEWNEHNRNCWKVFDLADDEERVRVAAVLPVKKVYPIAIVENVSLLPPPIPLKSEEKRRQEAIARMRANNLTVKPATSLLQQLRKNLWLSSGATERLAGQLHRFKLQTVGDLIAMDKQHYTEFIDNFTSPYMRARIERLRR